MIHEDRELILSGWQHEASQLYNVVQELFAEYPDLETRVYAAMVTGVISSEDAQTIWLYYYDVIRRLETNEGVS